MNVLELLLENKVDYIARHQGDRIEQRASRELGQLVAADQIIMKLAAADPTGDHHKYLQWIVNQYINNQFRLEDVGRIRAELVDFERVKSKLDKRDINQYKDLHSLYAALKPFDGVEVVSNRSAERMFEQRLYDTKQIVVVSSGPTKILEIHSEDAAKFLGRKTKWCTAADKNNMFGEYNEHGQLYVIFWKGKKYQFHFEVGQFMDEEDILIKPRLFWEMRQDPAIKQLCERGIADIAKSIRKQDVNWDAIEDIVKVFNGIPNSIVEAIHDMEGANGIYDILRKCTFNDLQDGLESAIIKETADGEHLQLFKLYATSSVHESLRSNTLERHFVSIVDPSNPDHIDVIVRYVKDVVKGRWKVLEDVVLTGVKYAELAAQYAGAARTHFPALEAKFKEWFEIEMNRPVVGSAIDVYVNGVGEFDGWEEMSDIAREMRLQMRRQKTRGL